MLKFKYLYDTYFAGIRKAYGKRALADKTITQRMHSVIQEMSIQDRYYLELLDMYKTTQRVASMAEITHKQATHRVQVALNHLIYPNTISQVTGVELFTNQGDLLAVSNMFTSRTLNAMRRQGIYTHDDLLKWLDLRLIYLYNIPGVGKWGQLEILKYLESTGALSLKKRIM